MLSLLNMHSNASCWCYSRSLYNLVKLTQTTVWFNTFFTPCKSLWSWNATFCLGQLSNPDQMSWPATFWWTRFWPGAVWASHHNWQIVGTLDILDSLSNWLWASWTITCPSHLNLSLCWYFRPSCPSLFSFRSLDLFSFCGTLVPSGAPRF